MSYPLRNNKTWQSRILYRVTKVWFFQYISLKAAAAECARLKSTTKDPSSSVLHTYINSINYLFEPVMIAFFYYL
jgi:hypothetical protein